MLDVQPAVPSGYPFNHRRHFICTYIGAHGRWNKIETILEAAQLLAGNPGAVSADWRWGP